jgi:hypothetical protein
MPISMVGKPSQIGGIASKIIGGGVIGLTLLLVTLVTLLAVSLSSTVLGALAVLLAMLGGFVGFLLLRGGKKLVQQGAKAQRDAREQALITAARARGGILTATEAAAVLDIQVSEADALLTQIAKEGQHAHVEVDRNGVVKYVFHEAAPVHVAPTTAMQDASGVRVDLNAPTQLGAAVDHKEAARQRVDREFENLRKTRAARGE